MTVKNRQLTVTRCGQLLVTQSFSNCHVAGVRSWKGQPELPGPK